MTTLRELSRSDPTTRAGRSRTAVLRLLCLCSLAATLSCMRQTTTQQVLTPPTARPVVAIAGDTITYVVGIENSRERRRFLAELEEFIRTYAIGKTLTRDTVDGYVRVQILQPVDQEHRDTIVTTAATAILTPLAGPGQPEAASAAPVDTVAAMAGGTVTVFSQRGWDDEPWRPMVSPLPFVMSEARGSADAAGTFFTAEVESDRRIKLTLVGNPLNAAGGAPSAFDIVQAWTDAVRKHPAEGLALFRNVKGIEGFLRGEEAVIPGLQSVDSRTILVALARPDPHAVERLCSYRLLPAELGSGPYRMADASTPVTALTPNPRFAGTPPVLDKCIFKTGDDANPFVGFSLGKYDVVTLSAAKDVAYAREKLQASAHIRQYSEDYYFLAPAHESPGVRRLLRSLCNPRDLLTSVIRAEGSVLAALETPPVVLPETPSVAPEVVQVPPGTKPLSIIYRKSDPISTRIAQKLLADAARAGVSCSLRALDEGAYERALLARNYAAAVGWVAATITQSPSERLRLATMWFADETDEDARVESAREVPLFSVRRFVLCKKGIDFCRGTPASLCRTAGQ